MYVFGMFDVINNNKCVLFRKFIMLFLGRYGADILKSNPCIHKCETSGSITKGPLVVGGKQNGKETSAHSFWRFLLLWRGKRVICSNERHKNILCNARGRRKEKLT